MLCEILGSGDTSQHGRGTGLEVAAPKTGALNVFIMKLCEVTNLLILCFRNLQDLFMSRTS